MVVSQLAQLEVEFRKRRESFRGLYTTAEVEHLLGWTENRLFEILYPRELAPLRDSIEFRFRSSRKDLGLALPAEGSEQQASSAHPGIALAALRRVQVPGGRLPSGKTGSILDAIEGLLRQLTGIAEERRFTVRLCVGSLPRSARFKMWPPGDPTGDSTSMKTMEQKEVVRGRYVYKIRQGFTIQPVMQCPTSSPAPDEPEEACLDLLEKKEDQFLKCILGRAECEDLRDLLFSDNCSSS